MNGVDQPSADYDNVVVNGSWNGWQGWGVTLADEDGDGIFTGSLEVEPGTSFEYVAAVTGAADGWSGWGIQWGHDCANANVAVTAGDAGSVTSTSLSAGCAEVLGCMDANASNYNADATAQGYDQWGNLQCVYASCDDIPEYGCIYADGFGAFNEEFNAEQCASYGGTPCSPCNDEAVQWAGDQNGDGFLGYDSSTGQTFITVESYPNIGNASLTINDEAYEMGYNDWGANAHWYAGFIADPTVTYEWTVTVSTCAGSQTVSGIIEATEEPCSGSILTMNDSYGDGWNGAVLTINDVDYSVEGSSATACVDVSGCTVISWTPGAWDSETSWSVGDLSGSNGSGAGVFGDCGVAGCTAADACNYNADATTDDGSCTFAAEGLDCDGNCLSGDAVTINMFDSYGDGGGSVTVGGVTATNSGSSSATTACVDLSACNAVDYEATDSWSSENSWSITDASGAELASGADADGLFGGCVSGCSDESAENYNADADIADDTLCEYALVQGCMDASACNYDASAQEDNGSCTYAAEGFDCDGNCLSGELLTMNDSWGDGWNGAVLTINDVDYGVEGSSATACVDLSGCTLISWTSGSYDSETSWTLGDLSGAGGSGAGTFGDCGVTGCTDATACNYNPDATTDDGSCDIPAVGFDCDGNCLSGELLTMNDSYGDGWNGAVLTINGVDYTVEGSSAEACVDLLDCNTVSWTAGSYDLSLIHI